jgi:hypothetical protein
MLRRDDRRIKHPDRHAPSFHPRTEDEIERELRARREALCRRRAWAGQLGVLKYTPYRSSKIW